MRTVSWTQMADGTQADYEMLAPAENVHLRGNLVGNLISMLEMMRGTRLGYQIDRYDHSLQAATRAHRNDESIDMVVGALLHDVADCFAPENHSAAAATLLEPYVDERTHWVVKHHGLFQGYYYFHHLGGNRDARDEFAAAEYYEDCVWFCQEYDQNCFDPGYDSMTIDDFRPMLGELFSRQSSMGLAG